MKTHTLFAVVCGLTLAGAARGDIDHADARYINVSGTAVTKVVPDQIVWRLTVVDENPELLVAKESNDAKMAQVLKAVDQLDVKPADVQSSELSFERVYERDKYSNHGNFKHYRVKRQVTVRQRDLDRFDEFLKDLVSKVELEASYRFESSKMDDIRWETRLTALKIAQKKAGDMAEVLGTEVGPVMRIEEPRPEYWGNRVSNFAAPAAGGAPDSITGTLAPGTIDIRVSVNVRFALD